MPIYLNYLWQNWCLFKSQGLYTITEEIQHSSQNILWSFDMPKNKCTQKFSELWSLKFNTRGGKLLVTNIILNILVTETKRRTWSLLLFRISAPVSISSCESATKTGLKGHLVLLSHLLVPWRNADSSHQIAQFFRDF